MDYLAPNIITLSTVVDTVTYSVTYYEPPALITGVTDEVHAEYVLANTYTIGTYVKVDALKKIFRAATAIVANEHPLKYPDKWVDYGPLNSYRMLATDSFINAATTGTNAVFELDFDRCDTFAFVAANFTSVLVELIDLNTTTTVFSQTYLGRDYGALTYSDYYFTDYKVRSRVVVDGLEWLPSSKIRLTFSGTVEIGGLVYGNKSNIGITLHGTGLRFQDQSKIATSDITGVRSVIRYGSVRIVEAKVIIDTNEFNIVANKIEAIIGRNVLWIPTSNDKFTETVSLGYIEDMSLPIDNPSMIETSTTIIGVL